MWKQYKNVESRYRFLDRAGKLPCIDSKINSLMTLRGALKQVLSQSLQCSVALLVLIFSSCYWSGPWPHVTDFDQCLGEGKIARYLVNSCCVYEEERIAKQVQEMLRTARATLPPRESAESIGMQCLASPNRTCVYKGEKGWRIDNPPPDSPNPDVKKIHMADILIVLSDYENPSSLLVQTTQRVLQ